MPSKNRKPVFEEYLYSSDSSSASSSDNESGSESNKKQKTKGNNVSKARTPFNFRCRISELNQSTTSHIQTGDESELFIVDDNGCYEDGEPQIDSIPFGLAAGNKIEASQTNEEIGVLQITSAGLLDGLTVDESEVKKLLEKAVIQPGFDNRPIDEVSLKSKRQLKKIRKVDREQSTGKSWFGMPATELTDETRNDLELIQMRNALDPETHYRKPERKVIPKFFQIGRVVENKADYYSSRLTKRQRKRTLVEELMNDHELIARNKRRYDKIMAQKAKVRRGVFVSGGYLPKRSKRKSKKH